jgi:selenide, water dikinase
MEAEMTEKIRLTQTVQKGGCAAKVAALELRDILARVRFPPAHPELLVDGRHFDDAAIYQVTPEIAMVQTIDFFTPIVDSPGLFGRIAACNALSDVYAMGGRPVTALGVLAFPGATLDKAVIAEVLQGAADQLTLANSNLVGGHSIDDDTLKFGLAVTGYVHPRKIWTNQGAKPGDKLILTKGLGTGTLTAALKRGAVTEQQIKPALDSMTRLNNVIDFCDPAILDAVHAATDITGFGLSGHALQMCRASGCRFRFGAENLPVLAGAPEFLEREFLTKAHRTNREYTENSIKAESLTGWRRLLIHDPQTSGGLLLAVQSWKANDLLQRIAPHFPDARVVGEVLAGEPGLDFV